MKNRQHIQDNLAKATIPTVSHAQHHLDTTAEAAPMHQKETLAAAPAPQIFAATPSWSQDFSALPNGALSDQFWNFDLGNNDGWGNEERQYYTDKSNNVRIEDHNLIINGRRENNGQKYTSARLNTEGKFDFTYGRLRVDAKLPEGAGVWPAIWLWPTDKKYDGQPLAATEQEYDWLANGEIDITEGQAQGDNQYSASAHAVLHHPGEGERTGYVNVDNATNSYHTYGLDWTPDKLIYSVDEKPFYEVDNPHTGFKEWPYDQQYHLILNIAMGGAMSRNLRSQYPPDGITKASSIWTMAIKSITYYPLANQ
jgi:beta-glucanase (GH16 family)